jgi:hypothetical protein
MINLTPSSSGQESAAWSAEPRWPLRVGGCWSPRRPGRHHPGVLDRRDETSLLQEPRGITNGEVVTSISIWNLESQILLRRRKRRSSAAIALSTTTDITTIQAKKSTATTQNARMPL